MRGCVVLLPLVVVSLPIAAEPLPSGVRVLSWNIDKGKQVARIAETIRCVEPHVVLLQEVDLHARRTASSDIAGELAQLTGMSHLFGPSYRELSQGGEDQPAYLGQAILTKLPIRTSRVLPFTRQTKFWSRTQYLPNWGFLQRREGGRSALIAELGIERTELVLYNLHLESRGLGATRLAQLEEALEDSKQYGPDVMVLIAGDFNSRYRPALFQKKFESAGFRNCFENRMRTHRLAGTLDWIAVRGSGTCDQAQVVRKTKGSDHDALSAVVTLRRDGPRAASSGN